MSDISDLESRISAAMDRISRGLESMTAPAAEADTSEQDALRTALEEEKLANSQLEERVRALNMRLEELEQALATSNDAIEKAVEAREAAEAELTTAKQERDAALAERDTARAEASEAVEAATKAAEEEKAAEEAREAEAAKQAESNDIDLDESRDSLAQLDRRLRRMRRTSRLLRGTNQQLREAVEAGLSDHTLVNQSLSAELNDLKANRAAELAEMEVIVSALRPILESSVDGETASEEEQA